MYMYVYAYVCAFVCVPTTYTPSTSYKSHTLGLSLAWRGGETEIGGEGDEGERERKGREGNMRMGGGGCVI